MTPGTRFGSYEVQALVGVGGMGEVYRARDTKLGREVALKLVAPHFTGDADRLARFEREAKTLASLNHASIASIYGLEESAGQRAIVMELVDGREPTGPLPVTEALQLARQIAEGLEFAHERGVIHRDLKPANLRVTADGALKILDFGLAKALTTGIEPATDTQVAMSPALSLAATQAGVLLGTAAYMAPEQAKGRAADRRADLWAFGVALYELLTGKRLFGGESVTETLASVMKEPITLAALPAETPRGIRTLLERCLERDPRRRLQSIGEARIAIEDALAGRGGDATGATPPPRASASAPAWGVTAAAVLVAAIAVGWAVWPGEAPQPAEPPPALGHFALAPPEGAELASIPNRPNFALSPDGRYLVFVAGEPGQQASLWVRALASLDAERLERTEGAYFPFWSPDSQHVGYFADGRLMRIALSGGAPLTVAPAPAGRGGSWYRAQSGDDFIVFVPDERAASVMRVPARGGVATPVTQLLAENSELRHQFPQVLPNGLVLFTSQGVANRTYVQAPGGAERTLILDGVPHVVYSPPGYLLYAREGALLAQRFDVDTLQTRGEAVAIAEGVRGNATESAFAIAPSGVVYRRGVFGASAQVRWYLRDGTPGDIVIQSGDYRHLELSPDGRVLAVAVTTGDGTSDMWLKDLATGAFQRLTSAPGSESQPAWSPESRRLAFGTASGIAYTELGSGRVLPVDVAGTGVLHGWTPDGKHLLGGSSDGVILIDAPVSGAVPPAAPRRLLEATYPVDHFRVSPDSRWVAYTSLESGRAEVVVATFPSFTSRTPVSLDGGTQPQWRADGRELFFHATDERLMAVDVTPGDVLTFGAPRQLFRTNPLVSSTVAFNYAATPDGQRFLLVEPIEDAATADEPLYLLTNWQSLLDSR
jgi:hypothetical protein